ncbi:hypothetical protein PRJ_4181 [Pseudomonas sp. XWY-1]|nr:hypothetical protein PRJ_4181 [Pseudomonas sp. XWY-1]
MLCTLNVHWLGGPSASVGAGLPAKRPTQATQATHATHATQLARSLLNLGYNKAH